MVGESGGFSCVGGSSEEGDLNLDRLWGYGLFDVA